MTFKSRTCNLSCGAYAAHSNPGNTTSPRLFLWLLVALCAVAFLVPVSPAYSQTTTSGATCKPGYIQRTPGGKCLISLGLANAKCHGRHGIRYLGIKKTSRGYSCRYCKPDKVAKAGKCEKRTIPYVRKLKRWEQPCKSRGKSESIIERIKRCIEENYDPNLKNARKFENKYDGPDKSDTKRRRSPEAPPIYGYKPEGKLPDGHPQKSRWFEPTKRNLRDEEWHLNNVVRPIWAMCEEEYPDRCRGLIKAKGGYRFKLCKPGFIARGLMWERRPVENSLRCQSDKSIQVAARAKCKAEYGELGWIIRIPMQRRGSYPQDQLYFCKRCPADSMALVTGRRCVPKEIVKVEASVKCHEIYGERCIGVFPTPTGFTYRFCEPGFIPHGVFRICTPKDGPVVVKVPVKKSLPVKKVTKPSNSDRPKPKKSAGNSDAVDPFPASDAAYNLARARVHLEGTLGNCDLMQCSPEEIAKIKRALAKTIADGALRFNRGLWEARKSREALAKKNGTAKDACTNAVPGSRQAALCAGKDDMSSN